MYIITLVVLLLIYVVLIFFMKKFKNIKLFNPLFCFLAFASYLLSVIIIYRMVGPNDWNFLNTLPVANISPFIFFVTPISLLLPNNIRKYYFTLLSLLSIGMILSPIINIIRLIIINYGFHFHFLLDYIAHMLISLFGIYIIVSDQGVIKRKDLLISGTIIIFVALIMMVLNVIFDKSFFGLSLNGKHNIYNVVLVDSSYLSALIYFVGLISVLIVGYYYSKFINHLLIR